MTLWPRRRIVGIVLLSLTLSAPSAVRAAAPLEFHVTFDKAVSAEPFTGRVYVLLTKNEPKTLPSGPNWFKPEPFFAVDVKDWAPGKPLTVGADAIAFPTPLPKLKAGTYYAQAVLDFDRGARSFSAADGNGYIQPVKAELDPDRGGAVEITIDQIYKAKPFPESDRVKLVDIESKLLTEFNGRPTRLRAGVVLPRSFAKEPERRYPVIYDVPGFGGTHVMALRLSADNDPTDVAGVEMLYVVPDPSCRHGHHVFADSANNGPYGRAFVEELIPFVEKTFRGEGKPQGRFVTGHSSGGWSSLWLQVAYPDVFGGVWSTSPDPVDFHDFQRIDVYKPGANMFTDEDGKLRPLARMDGKPVLFYQPFSDMESVTLHGGQLPSFEAVFSPRGDDGRPMKLWDRKTGAVDPEVVKSWQRYDIRDKLEREWKTVGPKLTGKLHVYTGSEDTFYLEGAVRRLQESLKKLESDAVVEIVPEKTHFNLLDKKMRERIAGEMAEAYRAGKASGGRKPPG
jgi:pimeloyl-ACP methyl ester carboxylesterase